MVRPTLPVIAFAIAVAVGCGSGGLEYWLYPEPHLPESEEALFLAHEQQGLVAIDGEDTAVKCWGDRERMGSQAHRPRGLVCQLHIRPGQHSILFHTGLTVRERYRVEFVALPGKVCGLQTSGCVTTFRGDQRTCRVEVVEIERSGGGG